MSSNPTSAQTSDQMQSAHSPIARKALTWSSFLFAVLQSICTFFASLNGLRLIIGTTSLALSVSVKSAIVHFHADWIRVPMILAALIGSVLNLIVLAQIRRLRRRPAAQWRIQPVSPATLRGELLQFVLSVATLVLIGIEESIHYSWHHHL